MIMGFSWGRRGLPSACRSCLANLPSHRYVSSKVHSSPRWRKFRGRNSGGEWRVLPKPVASAVDEVGNRIKQDNGCLPVMWWPGTRRLREICDADDATYTQLRKLKWGKETNPRRWLALLLLLLLVGHFHLHFPPAATPANSFILFHPQGVFLFFFFCSVCSCRKWVN